MDKLSQKLAIVSTIDPDAYGTGTQDGDWVNLGIFRKVMFAFMAGTLGSSATADCSVRQATDGSGSNAKAITGKSATQLTQAGTDDDKQVVIEVNASELDVAGRFTHVAPRMVILVAASDAGCAGLAGVPRYHPAADNDLASVDEILN